MELYPERLPRKPANWAIALSGRLKIDYPILSLIVTSPQSGVLRIGGGGLRRVETGILSDKVQGTLLCFPKYLSNINSHDASHEYLDAAEHEHCDDQARPPNDRNAFY